MLGFKKFTRQIKSLVIPCYEKFFILRLISSHPGIWKIILRLITSPPRVYFFYFTAWSAAIPKREENFFSEKCKKFFQGEFFLFFWTWVLKIVQVAHISATLSIKNFRVNIKNKYASTAKYHNRNATLG